MQRLLYLLILILSVLVAGCGDISSDSIRFGIASAPINLDPRYARDASSARINRLVYRRLVEFDKSLRPVPSLAKWERLSPLHYRFRLMNEGRSFHNGLKLTAEDVRATYASVLDKSKASPHRSSLAMIESIRVIDQDTVDFHLNRPDLMFPAYLVIGILPAKGIREGHSFNRHPLGSGPFRFVSWPEDGVMTIKRIRDGQKVSFVHVGDANVRALKLIKGEIDLLQNDLPVELRQYLSKKKGIYTRSRIGTNFTYFGLNFRDPDLARLKVRKAIAHAINRQEIIHYLLGGKTRPAESIFPPEHWVSNRSLKAYDYNPGKARKLLSEAGYSKDRPLRIDYKTSSDPLRIRIATIIQKQLADVGVVVRLRSYDFATVLGDIKSGRFEFYSLTWVGVKSPDMFKYVFHSGSVPPSGGNRGRYRNAEVDRLITLADASQDMNQRADYYRRIQAIVHNELPYIPLWYEEHFYAARQGVSGYRIAGDGNYDSLVSVRRITSKKNRN